MPDESIEPRDHYVYVLYREDGITPFYIGMGVRDRWKHHETRWKYEKRSHKTAIIKSMQQRGIVVPKAKLAEGLSLGDAITMEMRLIAEIGREPNGPLTNLTDGGEGVFGLSPEKIAERTASLKRTYSEHPELRERLSTIQRTRPRTPLSEEHRAKLSATNQGHDNWSRTPQKVKDAQSEVMKGNGERQLMMKRARRAKADDPEFVARRHARISAAQKKHWAENREYMIAARRAKRPPPQPKAPYDTERRKAVFAAYWAEKGEEIRQKKAERKLQKTLPPQASDSPKPK